VHAIYVSSLALSLSHWLHTHKSTHGFEQVNRTLCLNKM
jgi:hypothetical protein